MKFTYSKNVSTEQPREAHWLRPKRWLPLKSVLWGCASKVDQAVPVRMKSFQWLARMESFPFVEIARKLWLEEQIWKHGRLARRVCGEGGKRKIRYKRVWKEYHWNNLIWTASCWSLLRRIDFCCLYFSSIEFVQVSRSFNTYSQLAGLHDHLQNSELLGMSWERGGRGGKRKGKKKGGERKRKKRERGEKGREERERAKEGEWGESEGRVREEGGESEGRVRGERKVNG